MVSDGLAYSVVGFSASSLTFLTGKSVFLDFPVASVLGVARTFAETALTFIAYFIIGRTRKTGCNMNGGATWHSGAWLLEFASKNLCHISSVSICYYSRLQIYRLLFISVNFILFQILSTMFHFVSFCLKPG